MLPLAKGICYSSDDVCRSLCSIHLLIYNIESEFGHNVLVG